MLREAEAVVAEGEQRMLTTISTAIRHRVQAAPRAVYRRLLAWTRPATGPFVGGAVGDLTRTKAALVAENAFSRQPLVVLARQVKRPPVLTPADRLPLVLPAPCWPFTPSGLDWYQPRASSAKIEPRMGM